MPFTRSGWAPAARVFRPIHGRLALAATGIGAGGAGFFFGWELVRRDGDPRAGVSPVRLPAPDWLPVAGGVLVAVAVVSLAAIHLSAPVSTGERLPEHLRRPVDERAWPILLAMLGPMNSALVVTAIASTESSNRWQPVWFAALFTFVGAPMIVWMARHRQF